MSRKKRNITQISTTPRPTHQPIHQPINLSSTTSAYLSNNRPSNLTFARPNTRGHAKAIQSNLINQSTNHSANISASQSTFSADVNTRLVTSVTHLTRQPVASPIHRAKPSRSIFTPRQSEADWIICYPIVTSCPISQSVNQLPTMEHLSNQTDDLDLSDGGRHETKAPDLEQPKPE